MKYRRQSFPILSWVDLPRACNSSACMAFHIHHYRIYFGPQETLSISPFRVSLDLGTFRPRRWSITSPTYPGSKHFVLSFVPVDLIPSQEAVPLPWHAPSSPLSTGYVLKALPSI